MFKSGLKQCGLSAFWFTKLVLSATLPAPEVRRSGGAFPPTGPLLLDQHKENSYCLLLDQICRPFLGCLGILKCQWARVPSLSSCGSLVLEGRRRMEQKIQERLRIKRRPWFEPSFLLGKSLLPLWASVPTCKIGLSASICLYRATVNGIKWDLHMYL